MKSLYVHATLLAAALVLAFFTWTASNAPQTDKELVEIWDRDPASLVSLTFQSPVRTLAVERRDHEGHGYLWAVETTRPPAPPRPDSTAAPAAPAAPQVDQYPLGEQGTTLFEGLARLRAVRDLGKPNAEDRAAYGLASSTDTLTLGFRGDERRVLVIGGPVVGGGDRYVFDTEAGRAYVLPAEVVQPLGVPGTLRLTRLQNFPAEAVRSVVLRAAGMQRVMNRAPSAEPPYTLWTAPGSTQPDQGFANFMGQLDGLWVSTYRPALAMDTLQAIARIDFLGERADTLGAFELYRTRATPPTYYVRTSATIVPAEGYAPVAERIEQDVRTLFGNPAGAQ